LKKKILDWIKKWEDRGYSGGIPDEAPRRLEALCKVPSYRMICIAIMKNDKQLESLGYSRIECHAYRELKKIEIEGRSKEKTKPIQRGLI
jgi:predicted phosphoadenosine phosphosulfate sulfurtransferase